MKTKLSVFVFFISVLFFSCGGAVIQDNDVSLSLDTGSIVRYVTQHSETVNKAFTLKPSANLEDVDFTEFINYALVIRASTEGGYSTTTEQFYKTPFGDVESPEEMDSILQDLYRKASASPITLENIPVGKRIKVKINVVMATLVDTEAYVKVLEAEGYPSYLIEQMKQIFEMNKAEVEQQIELAQGVSEEFIVKSGQNTVKLRIRVPGAMELEDDDENTFDIILYNRISNEVDPIYGLWSYNMMTSNASASFVKKNNYVNAGKVVDFGIDVNGNTYYVKNEDSSYEVYYAAPVEGGVKVVEDDQINLSIKNQLKLYVGDNSDALFFAVTNDGTQDGTWVKKYELSSFPLRVTNYGVNNPTVQYQGFSDGITDIMDFAVSLGSGDESEFLYQEDDLYPENNVYKQKVIYDNAFLFLASSKQTGSEWDIDGIHYDIVLTKIPMTYKMEDGEVDVSSVIVLNETEKVTLNLSECNIGMSNLMTSRSVSVSDMLVKDGFLYVLLNYNKNGDIDAESVPDIVYYPVYSNGCLLKISISNFSVSGITEFGFSQNNTKEISMIPQTQTSGSYNPQDDGKPESIEITINQPKSLDAPYFFGPRKFIAVKPKKLVIADDGCWYYKDGDDFCYKNLDRVVVFNEKEKKLKAYSLNTADIINFDSNLIVDFEIGFVGTAYGQLSDPIITIVNRD